MEEERVRDEFSRMKITAELIRFREMISQYEAGLAFRRQKVENYRYRLDRLDQKLGGSNEE